MLNQLLTDIRAFLDERVHPMEREFLNTPFITIKPKLAALRARRDAGEVARALDRLRRTTTRTS